MMPFDDDDELRRRLASLGADLDQAGLPGPTAARERAAQRTRHQITTGVAAGVAVVALGGLGIVQVFDGAPDQIEPMRTPPAPTTTEPAPSDGIPESAMLTPDAIVDATPVEWTATAIDALPAVECVPDLPADTVATRSVAFTAPVPQPDPAPGKFTSPAVRHDLLRVAPGTAADVAEGLVSSLAECVPNQVGDSGANPPEWIDRFTVANVGERMDQTRYWANPVYDDIFATMVEYSVVAQDDLVSIVTRTQLNTEPHRGPDFLSPVGAADHACTVVFGQSCVTGDPEPEGLADYSASDPEATAGPSGDDPSDGLLPEALLQIEDIEDDASDWQTTTDVIDQPCFDTSALDPYGISTHYAASDSGSQAAHYLYRSLPVGAGDTIIGSVEDCVGTRAVERTLITGVGAAMWATVYTVDGSEAGVSDTVIHTSVMEYGSVTSVVVQTMDAQDWPERFGAATAINAADRTCAVLLGETCVGTVGFESLDDVSGIPADLLADDQISPIGTAGDFTAWRGAVDQEVENLNINACLDDTPDVQRWRMSWTNDLDASFAETILRFGSQADATAFVEAHAARSEADCAVDTGDMFVVTNTQPDALEAGDAAYTWSVEHTPAPNNPGSSGSFFAAGIAGRGDVVVVLTFGAMNDPLGNGWTTYMEERLGLALDAATDG